MNYIQFYQEQFAQVMSRARGNSRAGSSMASTIGADSPMIVANNHNWRKEKGPEITILTDDSWEQQQSGKAGSAYGNSSKIRAIHDFIISSGRRW